MHDFLIQKLSNGYNKECIDQIIDGLSLSKYTTLRINRLKTTFDEIRTKFDNLGISYSLNDDYEDAMILDNYDSSRGQNIDRKTGLKLENFDFYKNGKVYLQTLSSMKPVYILDPKEKENILDMCAAPGSKTTFIQSICNNKVNLTAVELHKDRFERLKYNVENQGANVLLLNQNALDLNDNFKFDKIMLDAPCSGSGTLDLNSENYKKYFTSELISKCVNTQKKLIKKAAGLLSSGKTLIYSTCSLLREENENIVDFATSNGFSIVACGKDSPFIKIFPDAVFEGFFIAKLIKL